MSRQHNKIPGWMKRLFPTKEKTQLGFMQENIIGIGKILEAILIAENQSPDKSLEALLDDFYHLLNLCNAVSLNIVTPEVSQVFQNITSENCSVEEEKITTEKNNLRQALKKYKDLKPLFTRNLHAIFSLSDEYMKHSSSSFIDSLGIIGTAISIINFAYPLMNLIAIGQEAFKKYNAKENDSILNKMEKQLAPFERVKLVFSKNKDEIIHNIVWFPARLIACFIFAVYALFISLGLFVFGFVKSIVKGVYDAFLYHRWTKRIDQELRDSPLILQDNPNEKEKPDSEQSKLLSLRSVLIADRKRVLKERAIDSLVWGFYVVGFALCFVFLPAGAALIISTCVAHFAIKHKQRKAYAKLFENKDENENKVIEQKPAELQESPKPQESQEQPNQLPINEINQLVINEISETSDDANNQQSIAALKTAGIFKEESKPKPKPLRRAKSYDDLRVADKVFRFV
ncbi:MAG: hypothetical protein ACD_29C00468G0002 [uncultured bacterium]|nr:MAG: hypothetical protein ACD_29C00468G0002 [uncultured bacterium]